MVSAFLAGRSSFVRELRRQDLKFELSGLKQTEATLSLV